MKGFSFETKFEIWNDDTGEHVEVGPDRDGIDMVEIRLENDKGKIDGRMSFDPEEALLVAEAIKKAAEDIISKRKPSDL